MIVLMSGPEMGVCSNSYNLTFGRSLARDDKGKLKVGELFPSRVSSERYAELQAVQCWSVRVIMQWAFQWLFPVSATDKLIFAEFNEVGGRSCR